jgi:hypothetical protein
MSLEQKIREIFVECSMRGKLCPRPKDCSDISCSECKIEMILALLQPQQQGEVISREIMRECLVEAEGDRFIGTENAAVAQLAHNKARMKPLLETVFSLLMGIKSKVDTESYYKDTTLAKTLKEIAKLLGYKEQS